MSLFKMLEKNQKDLRTLVDNEDASKYVDAKLTRYCHDAEFWSSLQLVIAALEPITARIARAESDEYV
ncbi:MAG: hypothetical protein ACXV2C_08970 [Candidatus Bathyarchaeia archaeon]